MKIIINGLILLFATLTFSNTYTVTNNNNSGIGSFDQAVTSSEMNPGKDEILIDLPNDDTLFISSFISFSDDILIKGNRMTIVKHKNSTAGSLFTCTGSDVSMTIDSLILEHHYGVEAGTVISATYLDKLDIKNSTLNGILSIYNAKTLSILQSTVREFKPYGVESIAVRNCNLLGPIQILNTTNTIVFLNNNIGSNTTNLYGPFIFPSRIEITNATNVYLNINENWFFGNTKGGALEIKNSTFSSAYIGFNTFGNIQSGFKYTLKISESESDTGFNISNNLFHNNMIGGSSLGDDLTPFAKVILHKVPDVKLNHNKSEHDNTPFLWADSSSNYEVSYNSISGTNMSVIGKKQYNDIVAALIFQKIDGLMMEYNYVGFDDELSFQLKENNIIKSDSIYIHGYSYYNVPADPVIPRVRFINCNNHEVYQNIFGNAQVGIVDSTTTAGNFHQNFFMCIGTPIEVSYSQKSELELNITNEIIGDSIEYTLTGLEGIDHVEVAYPIECTQDKIHAHDIFRTYVGRYEVINNQIKWIVFNTGINFRKITNDVNDGFTLTLFSEGTFSTIRNSLKITSNESNVETGIYEGETKQVYFSTKNTLYAANEFQYLLMNIEGKVIESGNAVNQMLINVPNGIYFVKVIQEDKETLLKISVIR